MSTIETIKTSLEQIEDKVIGSLEGMKTKQAEIADRLLQLEQKGCAPGEPVDYKPRKLSDHLLKQFNDNRELLGKTKSLRFEVKAASDVVTTTSGRNIVPGGVGAPTGLAYGVQNALRQTEASGTSAVEYYQYQGLAGAAGVQAGEGAAKPAVRPTHTAVTQSALTVAGWTKISRQAMSDSTELRQAIDITLVREVGKALDVALMDGNVSPAFSGLETLATSYTSLVYATLWDAASEAVATMSEAGFVPDSVVLSPADWLAIQTAVNSTTGDYYWGGGYLAPLGESLRGLRVTISPSMPAGKIMVMDSQQIELKIVDSFAVEVAYVDDDFIKNQTTILGELRVIPVYRSVGAARLITPKFA